MEGGEWKNTTISYFKILWEKYDAIGKII